MFSVSGVDNLERCLLPFSGMLNFYVTPDGLAAAVRNPTVREQLRDSLLHSAVRQPRKMLALGYLAREQRRQPRLDTTTLVLSGLVDQIAPYVRRTDPVPEPSPRVRYTVTKVRPARLGPSLQQVYTALAVAPATTPELYTRLPQMDRNTLRWAVQVLRQRHFVRTVHVSEKERKLLETGPPYLRALSKAGEPSLAAR
jgi:hypothetical protein